MSPLLLGVEEEGQTRVSSPSVECISQNGLGIREWNYLGLSDFCSVDSSGVPDDNGNNLNLKATELRLGLPGSQSPERETELCFLNSGKLDEKTLFPLLPSKDGICSSSQKSVVTGNKRGFSEVKGTIYTEKKWMGSGAVPDSQYLQPVSHGKYSVAQASVKKDGPANEIQEQPCTSNGTKVNRTDISNNSSAPTANRAQVVGWPPIRSFRTKTLTTSSKNNDEVDGKPGPGTLFVKVSMDGAPYLRKVDLRMYSTYQELSSALEKMFSCFTLGQCGAHGTPGKEILSESKLKDLLHGSEYVLTYEDKDGDWMLVGDVPWEMFIETCRRLKIMKSADAIGLAPKAMDKSKKDC
ncbi:auxin-responsive protein IAA9 isoform X1 [Gossypium raimondii]|uniref:Auxin-responsive protein n=1 Tax=Gossypium raimondii TaxID=29730 RepID=A0A0D2VL25_GOSRA|nr:auxin-responsive protein IAA9 isoform X1 [Gossypium raimondii]XP_052478666.1 auxin-responsive protein IAA9 isoform X1 [Gossypium raimondii]KJB71165.1 hypothetical protein B456_011G109000 [Gossypium raimondii]KJB71170.1 hypothetical protein B456_011G109000 [Gossypium raimondii]